MHPDTAMEERAADPTPEAPAPVVEGKGAPPPDDGPDFDLSARDRAFAALFPVSVS